MAEYQRPVLLLNEVINGETVFDTFGNPITMFTYTTWEGSARGYDKSALTDFRKFCLDSGCIDYAEGHANAFGFGINSHKLDEFINYCDTTLKDFEFTPCYSVDFIFNADNFNPKDIIEIADLKSLWGQGVEEPYIALTNVRVTKNNIQLMSPDKSPTLKITLPNGTTAIKFKFSKKEFEKLNTEGCLILDIVGRCEINAWGGKVSAQIIMEDYDVTNAV
jgi:single-stranded-DNA-specific exonuclease